jgi:hypothetical protein
MKKVLLSGLALSLGLTGVASAQEAANSVVGSMMTITGCVVTDKENSFVLTHVEEISGPRSTAASATLEGMAGVKGGAPGVIYWLSSESVKMMRGHLGHKVEVTGKITDLSDGTIKVKQEPGKAGPDNTVKIEAREKDSTANTDQPVVAGPPATVKTEATRAMPVRRIKVDTVKMVANVCP